MRLAVVDIGTNSTRLIVADVTGGHLREIERRSRVTGLGRGVEATGRLSAAGVEDVCAAIGDYLTIAGPHRPDRVLALATSAVRDASDGERFLAELGQRFGLDARVIDGDEEARLTFLGALADYPDEAPTLVFDIGGGSTELVVGDGSGPLVHDSLQLGVLRQSERHLRGDPPAVSELAALVEEVRGEVATARGRLGGPSPSSAIAVAGTPSSLAAIDLGLDGHDRSAVEGHRVSLATAERELARLGAMPLEQRRAVRGLIDDRAPMIVAGLAIMVAVLDAYRLEEALVSEHDILWGASLEAAAAG